MYPRDVHHIYSYSQHSFFKFFPEYIQGPHEDRLIDDLLVKGRYDRLF